MIGFPFTALYRMWRKVISPVERAIEFLMLSFTSMFYSPVSYLEKNFSKDKIKVYDNFIRSLDDESIWAYLNILQKWGPAGHTMWSIIGLEPVSDDYWGSVEEGEKRWVWGYSREDHYKGPKKVLLRWKELNPDWKERLSVIRVEQPKIDKEREDRLAKEKAKKQTSRQKYSALAVKTQNFFTTLFKAVGVVLAVGLLVATLFGAGYGIWYVIVTPGAIEYLLRFALIFVVVGILVGLLVIVVTLAVNIIEKHDAMKFVGKFFTKVASPFSVFYMYARAALSNSCPAIEWKE